MPAITDWRDLRAFPGARTYAALFKPGEHGGAMVGVCVLLMETIGSEGSLRMEPSQRSRAGAQRRKMACLRPRLPLTS